MGQAVRLAEDLLTDSGAWEGVLFEPQRRMSDGDFTCSGFAYVPRPGDRDPWAIASFFKTVEVKQDMPSGARRAQIKFEFDCPHCRAHHSVQNVTLTRLVVDAVMRGDTYIVIP